MKSCKKSYSISIKWSYNIYLQSKTWNACKNTHSDKSQKNVFFIENMQNIWRFTQTNITYVFFFKKMHFFHFHAMFLFFSFTLLSIINKLLTCLVGPDFNIYEVNMKHGHRINNVYSFSHTMDVIAFEQFCNLFLTRT